MVLPSSMDADTREDMICCGRSSFRCADFDLIAASRWNCVERGGFVPISVPISGNIST